MNNFPEDPIMLDGANIFLTTPNPLKGASESGGNKYANMGVMRLKYRISTKYEHVRTEPPRESENAKSEIRCETTGSPDECLCSEQFNYYQGIQVNMTPNT
jgi:hypothetical protein